MPQKIIIKDPKNGLAAEVANHDEKNGLVVATRPLKTYTNSVKFFSNDEYGADMNQDASAGGTPVEVHNGIDDVLWTATDIVGGGKTTFNSDDQNHTSGGTQSIKLDNSPVNDVFQLDRGSDLDCTGYVGITMWIYIDKDWKAGDDIQIYGWDTGTNAQIGDAVGLQNYFDYSTYDVRHKLTIPLSDMGALVDSTTLDALRVRIADAEGKSPKFYIDDIQFEETGSTIKFSLEADNGTWLHVEEFTISIADAYTGLISTDYPTMPSLPYNKLLGEMLLAGLNYERTQDGKTLFSQTILNLMGLMQLPGTEITGQGSDGTNTWITIRATHAEAFVLKSENNDALSWNISEDLTGLLHFRISAGCRVEDRCDENTCN